MTNELLDLNPISRITIVAVGPPGKRVFLLQASKQNVMITLKLEKEQARLLSTSIIGLIEELNEKYPHEYPESDKPTDADLMLHEPYEPAFQVGQIGLGYDPDVDKIVMVIQELGFEEIENPATVRFWTTPVQLKSLAEQTLTIVNKGRAICPLCDKPIDPDGHFCPKSNGHEKKQWA